MNIQTSKHNTYSYLRRTNEIVSGIVEEKDYVWTFEPLRHFDALSNVDMFIICITEQCNLRCSYCCYSGTYTNNRAHSNLSMTEDDVNSIIEFIKKTVQGKSVRIAFYGGEPLTQFSLLQSAIMKATDKLGGGTNFSISTNGTLLSNDKVEWLVRHKVDLYISIDGTTRFHDANRKDICGQGTFGRIHKALEYIQRNHPDFFKHVYLMMTLSSIENLDKIAEQWNLDSILCKIAPTMISGLAPNFNKGVAKADWNQVKEQHLRILTLYEQHPEYLVLKTFFSQCLSYWKNRPIVEADGPIPMATCLPLNTKLYIDAKMQIGVCEKISDKCRIGNIETGIDWDNANSMVGRYYEKRKKRCTTCPAIRMCDLCLTAVEFNDNQWDILCHNERIYAQLNMLLFCEMAERGMVS